VTPIFVVKAFDKQMLVDDVFYQNGMLVDVSGQVRTDGLAPKRAIDVHSGSVSVGKERSLVANHQPAILPICIEIRNRACG